MSFNPAVATDAGSAAGHRTVAVHENGKTISIIESKASGIAVTETQGGRKPTAEVRAVNAAELARKKPKRTACTGSISIRGPKREKAGDESSPAATNLQTWELKLFSRT
jgi:hypothetical protein